MNRLFDSIKGVNPALVKLIAVSGITIGGTSYLAKNGIYNVEAGHRAIKFNRLTGVGNEIYSEGMHFRFPWLEKPIVYDVRTRPRTIVSLTGSKDLQMVNISIRTLSRPIESRLPDIYRRLGMDFDEKVLPSIVNEVLKSVVAQFNASQLITQRELVSKEIRRQLILRAREFDLILDDVSITHLNFSPEYASAVEAKQVAQQQAERAKYQVLKAQELKKHIIIHAQGEAQSAEMIGKAIKKNPGFLELRKIDAAKEVSADISKSSNRVMLNSNSLMLNLMGKDDQLSKVNTE